MRNENKELQSSWMPQIKKIPCKRSPLFRPNSQQRSPNTSLYSDPKVFFKNINKRLK